MSLLKANRLQINGGQADTRDVMHDYWEHFNPSLESMMLDPRAQMLNREENAEILSHLPDVSGKTLVELGAGIGRFTDKLAARCGHVTAVDFMESYVEQNRKRNGHLDNVSFLHGDVMTLERPQQGVDVVFSNWLYMYLDDAECLTLFEKIFGWLREGGHLFLRESCYKPSGDVKRNSNPTFYRSPSDYYNMLKKVRCQSDAEEYFLFVEKVVNVRAYIKHKNNPGQVCFLATKMSSSRTTDNYNSFQEFLDQKQYSQQSVRRYEWIFGETFLSSGGLETAKDIVDKMNLKEGDRVLDVGCGVGGHDFYMAEKYGVKILAVDLSVNMMSVALEHFTKRPHLTDKIHFEVLDATRATFEEGSFDVIYSRDTLLHIADKHTLFSRFYKWLSPGGKVVFTDYCRGDRDHSDEFKEYVAERGYNLLTVQQYGSLMKETGFVKVRSEDISQEFLRVLRVELDKLNTQKDDFLKKFSSEDYEYLKRGWEAKIRRVSDGDQVWCLGYGEKPQ
ncbi:phosphoethanolamine N-methyltransferase 3 [Ixodes scapularis]|uniref:phosphoethanolamine N-methyltransferase 3 n=1 Tax=Ixodes scapularis TaxID=6945 RepID=UPI001A9DAC03|nr:phosphoethanolamine N-methyltransferase 3 [Ixodes scapularis]